VAASSVIQTNNLIFLPAPAEAIDSHIAVAGHPFPAHRGTFYITFVEEPQATVLMTVWEHFNPDATIVPLSDYYGTNVPSSSQRQQQSVAEMIDSQKAAELAAFNALGHPAAGEQVSVTGIDNTSKAVGKLQINDVILQANGQPVHTPQQLRQVVQRLQPGAPVALLVRRPVSRRDIRTFRLTIPTIRLTGRTVIGITPGLTFDSMPTHLPYNVKINSGDIGGPSAGLMFALSIINRLSPVDLTHGYRIAGTGTIDPDGNVGPIGGVKQKVIGARVSGARYFFVPANENYDEAKPYAKGITLVPVYTLDEAIAFLRHLS
jgi:PDZ domain-containing protein